MEFKVSRHVTVSVSGRAFIFLQCNLVALEDWSRLGFAPASSIEFTVLANDRRRACWPLGKKNTRTFTDVKG
jgi:hypothetical protein